MSDWRTSSKVLNCIADAVDAMQHSLDALVCIAGEHIDCEEVRVQTRQAGVALSMIERLLRDRAVNFELAARQADEDDERDR